MQRLLQPFESPAGFTDERQPGLQGAEKPGHGDLKTLAEADEVLDPPAILIRLAMAGTPGMQGLDQQAAARCEQCVQAAQNWLQRLFEQGEIAHQYLELP